ncbi:Glucose-1-phosphate thymidylyltransferase, long form [Methylophaga frappieri]|uniref:Glucose-1-phosphate thymidylyltransferase, long form n=2 Tax=Methylophaga frappieri (strain ATCC BAA-2434 / DSM 25690 / JAM7) TaxID=754477 RepID=I1YHB8_METFJ|nr:Glucose-1-phosphate thymidylyltransferase, long form [Methylophaga frappieri]
MRLLYMLLFGLVLYLALIVLVVVVVVQFVFALFTGGANAAIHGFSKDLTQYIHQLILFLTYQRERRPYPFNPLDDEIDEAPRRGEDYTAEYQDVTDREKE